MLGTIAAIAIPIAPLVIVGILWLREDIKNDELDWLIHRGETRYERFKRLVKKYQVSGFVYAVTKEVVSGKIQYGIIAEDLGGKVVLRHNDVYSSPSYFFWDEPMVLEIRAFMREVKLRTVEESKDYI